MSELFNDSNGNARDLSEENISWNPIRPGHGVSGAANEVQSLANTLAHFSSDPVPAFSCH
jgi:hypothetical protein